MSPWPARCLVLLMTLAAVACGDGDVPPRQPGWFQRVRLRPAPDAVAAAEDRIVFSEDVGAEPSPWSGDAPEVRTVSQGPGPRWLRLRAPGGEGELLATRRGALVDRRFDLVTVTALVGASGTLVVELHRDGRVLASSPSRLLVPGAEPVRLEVPLPHDGASVDELRLRFSGSARRVDVGRVELLQRDPLGWLGAAVEGPAPVVVGAESRTAVGVGTGRPWLGRLRVPGDGRLRWSWAVPTPLQAPAGARLQLEVGLEGDVGLQRQTGLDVAPGRWRTEELELGAWAGQVVDLRLSIASEAPAACAVTPPLAWAPAAAPRSVLLVTTDTHRGDHLGRAADGVEIHTPHLDALADAGVFFEHCYAPTNVTNPSHVALMTGTHPRDTGILVNNVPLADAAPTLAELFAERGFVTVAAISARHLGHAGSGLGQGFDRMVWPAEGETSADETVAGLRDGLREAAGQPVFAWLHLFDPHHPYAPTADDLERYWPRGRDPRDPSLPPLPFDDDVLPPDMAGLRDVEHPRAAYRAEITAMDRVLGELLADPRFGPDAVVAVVGDHGESLGAHGVWFTHAELYPDTLHVPLILRGPSAGATGVGASAGADEPERAAGPRGPSPTDATASDSAGGAEPATDTALGDAASTAGTPARLAPGTRRAEPVSSMDVGRTLLDLAGLEAAPFPGRSLVRPREEHPRFALSAHGFSASVTFGGLHLVLHLRDHHQRFLERGFERHRVELFDLGADPRAEHDLVDERPEVARALRERLLAWLADAAPRAWTGATSSDGELAATLAEMGYTAGTGDEARALFVEDDCAWCRRYP